MLLARTVFNKPTVLHSPVETMEPPTREIKTIDVKSRLASKGGGDPEPVDDEPGDEPPPEPADLEEPPEPEEPETVEPAPAPEYWSEYGYQSADDFRNAFHQQRQQAAQAEQYRQHAAVLWQMNQQALQRQQAATPPAQPKLPWEIPAGYSPDMESLLTVNEAGEIVARPGVDPTLPQKRREYQAARDAALTKFLSDPSGVIQGVMGDFVKQQAMQIAQSQIHEYHRRAALQQFEQQNIEWLYDAPGVLSPAGQMWNQNYIAALQQGFADPVGYATNVVDAAAFREDVNARAHAEANGITPDANAQKKRALIQSAARKPNRSGSFRKPGKSQTPPQNRGRLWADLRKKLEQLPQDDFDAA